MDKIETRIKYCIATVYVLVALISSVCAGQAHRPDVQAEFPGGTSKMFAFLGKHLVYPQEAIKQNASFGRTIVSFTVKVDGSLGKFKIIKDPGFGMGEELIRVLKIMPKWRPAKKSGKPVESEYTLPLFVDP